MTSDNELPSDPQREAAEAKLEEMGYEFSSGGRNDETTSFNTYGKDSINSSLVYDRETGELQRATAAIPEGEPYDSEIGLQDIDPEAAQSAIDYLQNDERVDYSNTGSGFVQTIIEPQESPEETADLLEDTVEAVETVADIRGALS